MDDFYRSQQSPRGESQMNASAFVSPPRNGPLLPRRFTTDSGRVPTLSTITAATQRDLESQNFAATSTLQKVHLLEKKKQDYERLREHRRKFEAEFEKLEAQQRAEERELQRMQADLKFAGHQSEPTTPPEYHDVTGFPNMFSRPNRYSTSSLTSPPGLFNRPARSGSQLVSPQSNIIGSRFAFDDQLPSRSVPGSRRNSDEDEKEEAVRQDPTSHRSTNALNRYSMPVTRSRTYLGDIGLEDSNNTTGFLFGDEDSNSGETRTTPTAPTSSNDTFPVLYRQQGFPTMLSASSSAMDLAQAQAQSSSAESSSTNGWNGTKHRSQQSLSTLGSTALNGAGSIGSPSEVSTGRPANIRHSLDGHGLSFFQESASGASDSTLSSIVSQPASTAHILATPPRLQQSFSANDVPTVKSTPGSTGMSGNANNHAQQHFHNHNASLGRIPAGAMPGRHSRELSNESNLANGRETAGYPSISSTLHANAAPFGPGTTQPQPSVSMMPAALTSPAPYQYFPGANYGAPNGSAPPVYNPMQPLLVQNMAGNGNPPPSAMYPTQNFTGYNALFGAASRQPQAQDSQARVIHSRRVMDSEAMARFQNLSLNDVGGTIYTLCKDQHGCRYLQKQLEQRDPQQVHMIWAETNQHVVELMTDPFGNYLCQKLLEYCDDNERTVLIQNAAPEMVRIALNQHGTRALQKMIEHVSSQVQINIIIEALRHQVVELIQDLNGNHVIQKCLNKLNATDATFIFDAVGNNCVDVGTHRHGCCVLQRCIDHADGPQKGWLINKITEHAVTLVQDPFGNYVVQYIIDLNEESFTEPIVQQFQGRIVSLSKHKFSSNVVEKCLRCSTDKSKDIIVHELLSPGEMDRLIRDSFANYVVQTALDYASTDMKRHLVDTIRPLLPGVRNTPYGRRIQAKVQQYDARVSTSNSGQVTPSDATGGQISLRTASHSRTLSNATSILNTAALNTAAFTTNSAINAMPIGANGSRGAGAGNVYPMSTTMAAPPPQSRGPPPQPPRSQLQQQQHQQFVPQYTQMAGVASGENTDWL
ncbi:armadillo-type protein [Diplogelasinospora grovesii]|uniref:Armadillo-type protein n=1 Tax=Diplogelasinospora grovesii TaxID=303347 RepID=A0AAN6NHV3_9PEZI|nr:armadillo-type protein [Diplogelasinospora grovesii]